MWVLVHVTDSVRPTDAFVTHPPSSAGRGNVAVAEGMTAPPREADVGHAAAVRRTDDARKSHRKAHGLRAVSLVLRRRARRAA